MQPLTKALRRRLKRLAPELSEQDIDRFERERRTAMQAALLEDPLYAAALAPVSTAGPESLGAERMRAAPPRPSAESERVVRELGTLVQRATDADRRTLDRKADRALAQQGEAARPKRPLAWRAAAKKAAPGKPVAKKAAAKRAAPKKAAPKKATRKTSRKAARKPLRPAPRRSR